MPEFIVNTAPLFRSLEESERNLEAVWAVTSVSATELIERIILDAFLQAIEQQDPVSWPIEYTAHLFKVLLDMPVEVFPTSNSLVVDFDLFAALGDGNDLEQAYHYHARLPDGGQVELPYSGEELSGSFDKRYRYWVDKVASNSNLWSETIHQRISTWGDKAPEWLFLQYGNGDIAPVIEPFPIIETINAEIAAEISGALLENMGEALRAGVETRPPVYALVGSSYRYRGSNGRFVKGP